MRTRTTAPLTALMLLVPLLAMLPASATEASDGSHLVPRAERAEYVPGQLLVRFDPAVSERGRAEVRHRQKLHKIRDLPTPGLELVAFPGTGAAPHQAQQVRKERAVHYAEPNFLYHPAATPADDPEYAELYGLHNTGQATGYVPAAGTTDADIDAPEGWKVTHGSSSVVVGVIDTGVDISHEDLAATIALNGAEVGDPVDSDGDGVITISDLPSLTDQNGNGRLDADDALRQYSDGVDQDANGYVDDIAGWDFFHGDNTVFDPHHPDDHGTHAAGTIAGVDNTLGVIGVSDARILPMKFLGPAGGSTADVVSALHYGIQRGVHLTNNSWGGGDPSIALQDAITRTGEANQLFVAAAGNGGVDTDTTPNYPSSFSNPNIVAVAATDRNDELASFSNHGDESVDLGAPGVDTYSTVPMFAKAVLYDGTYRSALHSLGLEGIASQADRDALVSALLSWAGISASDPILLVDDDDGANHEDVWISTLTSSAVGHPAGNITTFTVGGPTWAGPSAAEMDGHDLTIWFTGDDFETTLSSADRSSISTFLVDASDRLALFGIDIGFDLKENGGSSVTFLRDVLKTDYVSDVDLNYEPRGVAGVPAYGAVPVLELQPGDAYPGHFWSDALNPRSGAVAGLRGSPYAWMSGTSMAAPHVAGAAAQLYAAYPEAGYAEIRSRLINKGDARSSLSGLTVSGKRLNLAGALDTSGTTVRSVGTSPMTLVRGDSSEVTWTQLEPLDVTVTVVPEGSTTPLRTQAFGPLPAKDHSWTWDGTTDAGTAVADGSYEVAVVGLDARGNTVSGGSTVEVVSDAPPSATITSPSDGATVSGSQTVSASASDDLGVAKVEFLVDGVVRATEQESPYTFAWDTTAVADGSHTLTARATDTTDQTTTSDAVSVTVDNTEPTEPPEVEPTMKTLGGEVALSSGVLDELSTLTDTSPVRLAGSDRYATAAAIVADAFPGTADTVYVATGGDFPDALAGSAAAARFDAPVLLVTRDSVPGPIATQLTRLSPTTVKVLGGPAAVSDATVQHLEDLTGATVRRVAGDDRYATAAAVVADAFPGTVDTVYVATGADFPDALAGSAAAAKRDAPVVLVAKDFLPQASADQLRRLAPSQVLVLGGPSAVSDATVQTIGSLTAVQPQRLAGPDRYATAAAIVADAFPGAVPSAYVATGRGFPDALAGSAAAAELSAPVLLTSPDRVPEPIADELQRLFSGVTGS